MEYQLVLQFPASSIKDYDAMIELEERMMESLGDLGEVDGHDAGSGEMNLFVHTDHPKAAFEQIMKTIGAEGLLASVKAAYRRIEGAEYSILHPPGLLKFSVL